MFQQRTPEVVARRIQQAVPDENTQKTRQHRRAIAKGPRRREEAGADAGKILGGKGPDRDDNHEENAPKAANSLPFLCRKGFPCGRARCERRVPPAESLPLPDRAQKRNPFPCHDSGPAQDQQMPAVLKVRFRLRHQAGVLPGRFHRDQAVRTGMKNVGGPVPATQVTAQRSLIGVQELARITEMERLLRKKTEMRNGIFHSQKEADLQPVHSLIQVVVTEKFQLLHAQPGKEGKGPHFGGCPTGKLNGDTAPHAVASKVHSTPISGGKEALHPFRLRGNAEIGKLARGTSEAWKVGQEDMKAGTVKFLGQSQQGFAGDGTSVQEKNGRSSTAAPLPVGKADFFSALVRKLNCLLIGGGAGRRGQQHPDKVGKQ